MSKVHHQSHAIKIFKYANVCAPIRTPYAAKKVAAYIQQSAPQKTKQRPNAAATKQRKGDNEAARAKHVIKYN